MARRPAETVPLHRALLEDLDQMLAIYDRSVQELIGVSRQEGYFDDWDPELLIWPRSSGNTQAPRMRMSPGWIHSIIVVVLGAHQRRFSDELR